MKGFLASPRRRRRLKWISLAAAIVGALVALVVVVRQPRQPNVNPGKNAPKAQVVSTSTHVRPADRRAITGVLDRFIPAALTRSSMRTAWNLSGPELTGGSTLRQWLHGTSPIPYYPVAGKNFGTWTTIDAGRDYVTFNLLVHPQHGTKVKGAWVFSGEMIRRGSHWLVNRLYTIALLNPPTKSGRHEVGPADFAAGAPSSAPAAGTHGRIGPEWLAVIAGVIGLVILFPLGLGIAALLRNRRRRRQYLQARERELPPLPSAAGTTSSEPPREREPAGPRH